MRSMWQRVLHDEGGFLQFLPAIISGGKAIYDIAKGPDEGPDIPAPPEYYEDPDYRKMQDFLSDLGVDILGGDIPDYYKGIGETGGAEFNNYLNLITGDIQKSALETAAAAGRGVGAATDIATRNVNTASTQARYADFLRAMEGKQWLFGQGTGITESARAAGQQEGSNRNVFNLKSYGMTVDNILNQYGIKKSNEAAYGNLIGQDISNVFGAYQGAKDTGTFMGGVGGAMGQYDWQSVFDTTKSPSTTTQEPSKKINLGKIGDDGLNIEELLAAIGGK